MVELSKILKTFQIQIENASSMSFVLSSILLWRLIIDLESNETYFKETIQFYTAHLKKKL